MDVLLVDDHPIIHEVMRAVVRRAMPDAKFHAVTSLQAGISRGRSLPRLRYALIDLGLPGCSGIEALVAFRKGLPRVTAVVVSATDDRDSVNSALRAGAAGFIVKTSKAGVMVAALQLIASGGIYIPPESITVPKAEMSRTSVAPPLPSLTDRQSGVMRLLAKGLSYREIARDLGISESTVKQHAHAVYKTLGVSSRVQAMIALQRHASRSG
jgi:DNA-binding NarL/FixJ family response regulator